MADLAAWREKLEHNALWVALGTLALAGAVVAVGVQVAPETFYDRFWWEDIYGPLVVDARQCSTAATCPGLEGPAGVSVKDGYTVTSELTYGVTLAILLYGIYVGMFKKYAIRTDGWFVLGLLPWIMLGPLARALEDADVFCRAGTHCDPGPFAFVFISPVIYLHIAAYVIPAMLLGVYLQRRREEGPRRATAIVGGVLAAGVVAYALVQATFGPTFSAMPPLWFVAASALAALGLFHWRARRRGASMNLTVFALGLPYALGPVYLILRWLSGGVWSDAAWSGRFYIGAGVFILLVAALMVALVWALAHVLVEFGVERGWGRLAARVPDGADNRLAIAGLVLGAFALLSSGAVPRLGGVFTGLPAREVLVTFAGIAAVLLLAAYALLKVGRGAHAEPGVLLLFAAGVNLALVFGHVIDGVATWVALEDPLGFGLPTYSEKHPFSDFLLRYWDGFLFPVAKVLLVLVVAWTLDREVTKDNPDEQNLVGLVKMAIFVLGFGPGLRDLLRLAMGV